jgi:putative folate metabolism gamma-glutamate ligase
MIIKTVKTRIVKPPKDDLLAVIGASIHTLKERDIVVITSKVVAIWQGRCVPLSDYPNKDELVTREADLYLPRESTPGAWCMHTMKNNVFIPSAGIDESNAAGHYILWPRDVNKVARQLWRWLRAKYHLKNLGVIITDSHTIPLRRGVLGISLAHYGFAPLKDYRGNADIFGRELKMTQTNIADGLAAAAVVLMGEGSECTPLAIVRDVPFIQFVERKSKSRKPFSSFEIETQEDLYYPLLSSVPWKKGGSGKSCSVEVSAKHLSSSLRLNLVVIKSSKVEMSAAFYSLLGLSFVRHCHGNGPEHFAAEQNSCVIEIYPALPSEDVQNRLRLGFAVENLNILNLQLQRQGTRIISPPKNSPWGLRMVVLDPDNNHVEITQKPLKTEMRK